MMVAEMIVKLTGNKKEIEEGKIGGSGVGGRDRRAGEGDSGMVEDCIVLTPQY